MTTIIRFGFLLAVALVTASCTSVDRAGDSVARQPAGENGVRPGNEILVTFHDERVDRLPIADPADGYRRRGNYRNSTWSEHVADQLAEQYGLQPVAQWPITTLGVHCVVYKVPADLSVDQVLNQLAHDRRVEAAQSMNTFHAMTRSYSDPYFKLQAGVHAMHVESAHQLATGRDVRVAVIDTGVDSRHPDLLGQIDHEENFVAASPESANDIHGTAVAGIIAALANNGRGIVGIAPDARLVALKACWQETAQKPEASCNTLTLALALHNAITLKVDIVNMSLTGPRDPLLERLIHKALEEGIIVVAAEAPAGEHGGNFPASMNGVIAVRATEGSRPAELERERSVAAPGAEILTTLPHDTYNFMSGSSFAAAHVSGVIALLLELDRHLTAKQAAAILSTAVNQPASFGAQQSIDACSATATVRGLSTCLSQLKIHAQPPSPL